jgi:hypothetical protein
MKARKQKWTQTSHELARAGAKTIPNGGRDDDDGTNPNGDAPPIFLTDPVGEWGENDGWDEETTRD